VTTSDGRIAVLMACHDRRETTLRGVGALLAAETGGLTLRVFLVDDGSNDGTSEAIRSQFPEVRLIASDGTRFWARSMHLAWEYAESSSEGAPWDAYLWLNDDVELATDALHRMTDAARARWDEPMVIVGSCLEEADGTTTSYGGHRRSSRWHPMRFDPVEPDPVELRTADTLNGNVVLVTRAARATLGLLDPGFEHAMADTDYGLRATAAGVPVLVAPGHVGVCAAGVRPRLRATTILDRRALPPRSYARLVRRHGRSTWFLFFIAPYVRALWADIRRAAE
jgi:GT2 family glycosyltransferase